MGQDIEAPGLVSLTFHWNIMENQTSLSVHRAIKDKCVCYCSHSVSLSVLCAPLGDVRACCKSTINPKLSLFVCRKGMLLSDWRLTTAQGWMETHMTGSCEDWMDSSVWWMACLLLNHRALAPSETPTKACPAALGKSKLLNITLVENRLFVVYERSFSFVVMSSQFNNNWSNQ